MGAHQSPPRTQIQTYHSLKVDIQEYLQLQSIEDQNLEPTQHDCDICGLRCGGFDLLMHIHFVHNLTYSEICPCGECVVVHLNKAILSDRQREALVAESERLQKALLAESKTLPTASGQNVTLQPATATKVNAIPKFADKRSVSSGQLMNGSHVAQGRNTNVTPNGKRAVQQQRAPVQAPPSLSSVTDAPVENTQYIRIDSASPAWEPPALAVPAKASQVKKPTLDSRAGSVLPPTSLPAPPAAPKPIKKEQGTLKLVPEIILFYQVDSQVSEKNLPYELSKVESGDMYEENGRVIWIEKKTQPAPSWIDGNDNNVVSVATNKNMNWLPFLPHSISREVPAWQLVCWNRIAVSQGITIKNQDFIDRGCSLSASGITGRVQAWQRGLGFLSQGRSTPSGWPSKQAMDSVAGLTYLQAKFNTWWDVQFVWSHGVWMATQPQDHMAYRDLNSLTPQAKKIQPPYFYIEDPESRKPSVYVNLIDDAMLFLTIKAQECGMQNGYADMLSWFGKKAEDQWTRDLEADLILEFGRWREGCLDSPSLSVLRVALQHARSWAEIEAIKRADYSLTPWLQNVVAGLAPMRELRSARDAQKRAEVAAKFANKRTIVEVDDVQMGAGQSKKRAT